MTDITFYYTARGGADTGTGLTCTIDIYKVSDGSQVVTGGSMTEIGSTGEYKYEYTVPSTDRYLGIMNCSEKPSEKRKIISSATADLGVVGQGWATIAAAFELSGLDNSDVDNSTMANLCDRADLMVEGDVFVRHDDILLSDMPDGSRTEFRLPVSRKFPIGDRDRTSSSSLLADAGSDVTIYGIDHNDSTGYDESTEISVNTIESARDGRISFSSAPSSSYDALRANYVTVPATIKFQQVRTAASYLAAHLALVYVSGGEIPAGYSYKIGRFSIDKKGESKYEKLLKETWNGYRLALQKIDMVPISVA